ncbi:hypothetical protein AVEN_66828-1 [Araneus ventricosus]|uniref:Uncharacterized protein n=1 Tax=Araneus ventricosus TaxID=182803 RepID=A0A4Y2DQM7_ARAVE|nr:hypothetical protein AVEN_66828-1 [Araneus ventricosus]
MSNVLASTGFQTLATRFYPIFPYMGLENVYPSRVQCLPLVWHGSLEMRLPPQFPPDFKLPVKASHSGTSKPAYFSDLASCDSFLEGRRDNNSQVPKKCCRKGTGGDDKRIRIHIFVRTLVKNAYLLL